MIVYRVFRYQNKFVVKLVHFGLQLVAFAIAVLGLKAAFDFHNHNKIPNMYSLHSWLGISTMFLFTTQLAGGFISFLFPKLPDGPRASYHKIHIFFGVLIFMMAIATCLLGMTEKALFSIKATYSKFVPEGILINVLGVILVLLAAIVMFVVTNSAYKRVENDDEQKALMSTND
ncbi:cytochrome b561-like [Actinia tenebrosa]|uniref:Cytochrome b561-like n=1 Tax=Actinia tenebrosa TaxID=6105 RepID=A0A6P8IGR6_ACTTE|nr:cytochrome b561-like [Actinia tenebrosa]